MTVLAALTTALGALTLLTAGLAVAIAARRGLRRAAATRHRRASAPLRPLVVELAARGVLARQRRRWHRGLWQVLHEHRGMLLNPRCGRIGLLALPCCVVFELVAPLVELVGVVVVPLGVVRRRETAWGEMTRSGFGDGSAARTTVPALPTVPAGPAVIERVGAR